MRELKIRYIVETKLGIKKVEPIDIETIEQNDIRGGTHTAWERIKARNLYTLHKDKNGKEIYEGDIVRHYDYPWLKAGGISMVKWNSDACGFEPFIQESERYGRPLAGEWIEVIGNIYENKELLK